MKHPSLQYYCINKRNSLHQDARLILSISFRGNRVIHYPGLSLKTFHWDGEKRRIVNRHDAETLNAGLDSLKKQVTELYQSLAIRYGKVSTRHLRDELQKIKFRPGMPVTYAFLRFMEENEKKWSRHTFSQCSSFYKILEKFSSLYGTYVSIESVDHHFLSEFRNYMMKMDYGSGSLYSLLNLFKWFLNWAREKDLMTNIEFLTFPLKDLKPEFDKEPSYIYLRHTELSTLFKYNLMEAKLEHCRDIFCFMVYTGCKLEELQNLRNQDIGNRNVNIRGRFPRNIPLNKFSSEIIQKYQNKYYKGGLFFPPYSEMTLNKNIRMTAEMLNFDRKVMIRRRGEIHTAPLFELITINAAYQSFIVNSLRVNIPGSIIQKWSGRKSEKLIRELRKELQSSEKAGIKLINQEYEDT